VHGLGSNTEPVFREYPDWSAMRPRLDTIVNIATLVVCIAVLYVLFGSQRSITEPPKFKSGQELPALPGLSLSTNAKTLVVVLKSDCRFCEESMPFYRKLSEAIRGNPRINSRLIVIGPEDLRTLTDYVTRHGVTAADVVTIPRQSSWMGKISGTPTLIFADERGRIDAIWLGKLNSAEQEEVEKKLLSTSAS
jgi:hypothetical protein